MQTFLSQLKLIDNGAKWYKVDLHVHTPASHDYKDRSTLYEAIVQKALSSGLDMIAITDHNTGAGYKKMHDAAKNTKLVVLPGVEITVEGIHVLAIFPEKSTAQDVTYLLHNLKIKDTDMGKKETISSIELSIPQVLQEIDQAGGIPIIAHTDSSKGLTKEIKGVWRTKLVKHESLKVVEITKDNTKTFFDGSDAQYQRKLACIKSSDAHQLDEIAQRATWIKMGECNFGGLKQIIHEPDLRISLTEPSVEPYPRIVAMEVSGGLYADDIFHFNRNLNCIIGGRGAGKSAVSDFIRFTLDRPPRSEEYLREYNQRIVKLLGLGNSVRLCVENENGTFIIERRLTDFSTEKISGKHERIIDIQSQEQTYQLINGQSIETSKSLWEIFEIEVFGQGEVFELTRRADDQLKLIDEYIEAEDLFDQENTYIERLSTNAKKILGLQKKVDLLTEELADLDDLKEKITKLEEQLKADIFKKHGLWQAESTYFSEVKDTLASEKENIESQIEETIIPELPYIDEQSPNIEQLKEVNIVFTKLFKNLEKSRNNELTILSTAEEKIENKFSSWKQKFDLEEEKFRTKLIELGASSHQGLSNKLNELKREKFRLEKKVLPVHEKMLQALKDSEDKRNELLDTLKKTRQAIHEKRKTVVKQMSTDLEKGDVKIEINPAANRKRFLDLLDQIYTGSDIRRRKDQLQKICLSASPLELVDLIQQGDKTKLIKACGITLDTANKIISVPNLQQLFDIQTCPLHDELAIYLKKAKTEDFSSLRDLSYGEKCTAIFSIALLGKKKPLLVDQPEDELDHAFIIDNIVEHIRGVKEKRQLIVLTHNANIPVLGDAELIFKVTKVPGQDKCTIEERGAFEKKSIIDKLQDLEGGPEAFRRRREKYAI